MSFLLLDDKIGHHAKTIRAGNEAFGAWTRMVSHCGEFLTDGFIDDAVAMSIAGKRRVLDKLVAVRFLDRVEGGYCVHDYLDWNPSAAKVREQRRVKSAQKAEAGRLGGVRSGEARAKQTTKQNEAEGQAEMKRNEAPLPLPYPQRQNPSHTDPDPRDLSGSDRACADSVRPTGTAGFGVRS
jgi:hypothetical protein